MEEGTLEIWHGWGGQSDYVFTQLQGDFMRPRINEVDELLAKGVNVTIYNGQVNHFYIYNQESFSA
ncbi:hypothetical protein Pint_10575 [Pistacia integerrima]|uniref:Uncharacterized protein n=1 Tax=Pistacia integerrima TaxID=434235 RepID=A0ACC0XF33_9ROSI|nr:hypothetical protein Pint_10575 [Pistacia integerrima]